MDDREGSFVAVRRISQGLERGSVYNSSSGNFHPLLVSKLISLQWWLHFFCLLGEICTNAFSVSIAWFLDSLLLMFFFFSLSLELEY